MKNRSGENPNNTNLSYNMAYYRCIQRIWIRNDKDFVKER